MKTINEIAEEEIIANPTDNFLKLKYADLLEDQGNSDLAAAYRYCGENDKHPFDRKHKKRGKVFWFVWFDSDYWRENPTVKESSKLALPSSLLREYEEKNKLVCRQSFQEAMEFASEVLKCSKHSANELIPSASNRGIVSDDVLRNEED